MKIEVVEMLGSDQLLYGSVGSSDSVIARVSPNLKAEPGDRIKLGLNKDRLHLFDALTERAIG